MNEICFTCFFHDTCGILSSPKKCPWFLKQAPAVNPIDAPIDRAQGDEK